jgi:mannose-6-phosphate isomerase-like protein (cupin superfamily)
VTEYWFARRFPVGHWRNAMAPISPKARRVTRVFAGGMAAGMLAFFIFGLIGHWRIGAGIFAVLAAYSGWYYLFVPIKRFDRQHTVEDYITGRVGQGAAEAADVAPTDGRKFALSERFAAISEHWRPRTVAELNGQEVKLVKVRGAFPWHHHADADEMFLVWKGTIRLEFRDKVVRLRAGEAMVVPRGVEHRPVARREAEILLFEPAGVRNTGNIENPVFTAPGTPRAEQDKGRPAHGDGKAFGEEE